MPSTNFSPLGMADKRCWRTKYDYLSKCQIVPRGGGQTPTPEGTPSLMWAGRRCWHNQLDPAMRTMDPESVVAGSSFNPKPRFCPSVRSFREERANVHIKSLIGVWYGDSHDAGALFYSIRGRRQRFLQGFTGSYWIKTGRCPDRVLTRNHDFLP